jgi:Domain of unknown function (DUF1850)
VRVGSRRLLGAAALTAAGTAVAVAAAVLVTRDEAGAPAVVVADERGREVASLPLPPSGRFALQYRHSVYRAEVTETFAVQNAGFRLVAVASPSEAVLDHYELEGRRVLDGGWRRLEPAATQRLDALPVVATELGRRTLVVGSRRLPLFEPGRGPTRLVLTVRR